MGVTLPGGRQHARLGPLRMAGEVYRVSALQDQRRYARSTCSRAVASTVRFAAGDTVRAVMSPSRNEARKRSSRLPAFLFSAAWHVRPDVRRDRDSLTDCSVRLFGFVFALKFEGYDELTATVENSETVSASGMSDLVESTGR
jgi:hypothetical protein